MKISLIQMKIEENPFANIKKVNALSSDLQDNVVVLPELFTTGFNYDHINSLEKNHHEILELLNDKNIFVGSILRHKNGKKYNSFFIKNGKDIQFVYDKIHLFPLMNEDKHFDCGKKSGIFDINGIKCGATVCFDLRFPELYRYYFLNDVKIIFIPAEWPLIRKDHLITLAKSRAIENQCFVVLCNAVGKIWNEDFAGNSSVISPWGEFVVQSKDSVDEIFSVNIDLKFVEDARNRIPVKEYVKFEIKEKLNGDIYE